MDTCWESSRAISYWLEPVAGFGVGLLSATHREVDHLVPETRNALEDFLLLAGTPHSAYAARLSLQVPQIMESEAGRQGISDILDWAQVPRSRARQTWAQVESEAGHRIKPDRQYRFLRFGYRHMLPLARRISAILSDRGIAHALNGSAALALVTPFRVSADLDFASPEKGAGFRAAASLKAAEISVREVKNSYVGAIDPETKISIDLEFGGAYRSSVSQSEYEQNVEERAGLPVMHASWILGRKRMRGAFKDQVDLVQAAKVGIL